MGAPVTDGSFARKIARQKQGLVRGPAITHLVNFGKMKIICDTMV